MPVIEMTTAAIIGLATMALGAGSAWGGLRSKTVAVTARVTAVEEDVEYVETTLHNLHIVIVERLAILETKIDERNNESRR